jgi:ankyrin repeat protein
MRPLHYAAWHGHLQAADHLMSASASVNSPDAKGMTALHFAAWNNHLEVAEMLLSRGAMVDQPTQVCITIA